VLPRSSGHDDHDVFGCQRGRRFVVGQAIADARGAMVNLEGEAVEVHCYPEGDRYRHVERLGRGGSVAPQAFPDVALLVNAFLG
jgi:hypothetical protein